MTLTWGRKDRLLVLSAYRLTARSSSRVMWCCEPDRVVVDEDECDDEEQLDFCTLKMPGPSSDTESRAQDSSNECSGMIPRETAELPTFGPPVVNRAGVEWDSSWATVRDDSTTTPRQLWWWSGYTMTTCDHGLGNIDDWWDWWMDGSMDWYGTYTRTHFRRGESKQKQIPTVSGREIRERKERENKNKSIRQRHTNHPRGWDTFWRDMLRRQGFLQTYRNRL